MSAEIILLPGARHALLAAMASRGDSDRDFILRIATRGADLLEAGDFDAAAADFARCTRYARRLKAAVKMRERRNARRRALRRARR